MRVQSLRELLRYGHFAIFPPLGRTPEIWLRRHAHGVEINIVPKEVYDFLLAESSQKKCRTERILLGRARREESVEFLMVYSSGRPFGST